MSSSRGRVHFVGSNVRPWRRAIVPAATGLCMFVTLLVTHHARATLPVTTAVITIASMLWLPDVKLRSWPSHVWAPVAGAMLTLCFSGLGLGPPLFSLAQALVRHLEIPILILSFAYLAHSLEQSGFFDWSARRILRIGAGQGSRLLVSLFVGVSLLTFVTSNDIVILATTPVLIHMGRTAKIQNMTPFLITLFVGANTASMGLYVGNPTNIIIGSASGIGFLEYASRMFVPTLVSTLSACAILSWLFLWRVGPDRVPAAYTIPTDENAIPWTRAMSFKFGLFAFCLLVLGLFGNPWTVAWIEETVSLPVSATIALVMTVVSLAFASLALVVDMVRDRANTPEGNLILMRRKLRPLPWEIVPFFLSFCVILEGLQFAGITNLASQGLVAAFTVGPWTGAMASGFGGVLAVNAMNNIPAVTLFQSTWLSHSSTHIATGAQLAALDPSYAQIAVDTSLFASNFGANLTLTGALAGLIWYRLIREHADPTTETPTPGIFLRYGLCIVPPVTLATCSVIVWLRT